MFILCFVFYFLILLGRLNYSASLAEITTTGFMEKDVAGLLSTAFFITYGCSQLISGFITDKLQPFRLVALGVALAGLANVGLYLAFSAELGLAVYIAIWALNGLVQSVVWPTMIRIVSNVLPAEIQVTAGVGMLATTAVGTVLSYILSAAVMKLAGWQECFFVPGLLLILSALVWLIATKPIASRSVSYTEPADPLPTSEKKEKLRSGSLIPLMLVSGAFLMPIPSACFSIVKDGITTWTPTIITETFSTEPYISTLLTTVIPLISIFGTALSRIILPYAKTMS